MSRQRSFTAGFIPKEPPPPPPTERRRAAGVPWSSFMSRSTPGVLVRTLLALVSEHLSAVAQANTARLRAQSASDAPFSATAGSGDGGGGAGRSRGGKMGLIKRMFGSSSEQAPRLAKATVVEARCRTLLEVVGGRAPIRYASEAERAEAQLLFVNLASVLASYSRKASFDARNSLGPGVHMHKSAHVVLYNTIIALIDRPELDFRDIMLSDLGRPLQPTQARVAGEYWQLLLLVLQLVLDLVFWAREEEMQFAANFFAIAIFRLPSVGGHVVDSLHQFHSRAAAHFRKLYPSSTRRSDASEHAMMRCIRSRSPSPAFGLAVGSRGSSRASSRSSSPALDGAWGTDKDNGGAAALGPADGLKRSRSLSRPTLSFINANPTIFGWLTFESQVPGVDSGRVVEMMRKRKREWNGRLQESREFAMMLAAAVVDHVQSVIVCADPVSAAAAPGGMGVRGAGGRGDVSSLGATFGSGEFKDDSEDDQREVWWEEIPMYPVLADMVLLTLRRQFHLLKHPTDPSLMDDYETRSALRPSHGTHRREMLGESVGDAAVGAGRSNPRRPAPRATRRGSAAGRLYDGTRIETEIKAEEQEGNLVFSRPFFDTIVKTCAHFFSADPVMRHALLRMVCTRMDPERVSSVGPCLSAMELWLLRLHRVSPSSTAKCMQMACMRSAISALLRSSRFVCTCRALTFITTVVSQLNEGVEDEAVLWFLRDILFDHFFELFLSWSSFVRRFFHDFLTHRVFKLKRKLLDIPSDRLLFEQFPGDDEDEDTVRPARLPGAPMAWNTRVAIYDAVKGQNVLTKRTAAKRRGGIQQSMAVNARGFVGGGSSSLAGSPAVAADAPSGNEFPPVDPAALSPSDMALATKMEAYTRILLDALHNPSSFDSSICSDAEQRRVYIEVSLEGYADMLANLYKEQQLVNGHLAGEPPPNEIDISMLMRRFSEVKA